MISNILVAYKLNENKKHKVVVFDVIKIGYNVFRNAVLHRSIN